MNNQNLFGKLKNNIKDNFSGVLVFYDKLRKIYFSLVNPEKYLKKDFRKKMGYELNLDNPQSFNEKLQWMKLYWHDSRLIVCSDKVEVRNYLKEKGLGKYLNEVIDVFSDTDKIDLNKLPDKFVLKATHGSGWNIICTDKNQLDWKREKAKLKRWMKDNFYYHSYEWGYKDIKPRIVCEKFIEPQDGHDLMDYKIFCFDGIPKMLFVASERGIHETKFDYYTCDWELIPVKNHYPNSERKLPRPAELDEVLKIAGKASEGFPHVRVDFFIEEGQIYIGELTFCHFSGCHKFEPQKYDYIFGEYFKLPEKKLI